MVTAVSVQNQRWPLGKLCPDLVTLEFVRSNARLVCRYATHPSRTRQARNLLEERTELFDALNRLQRHLLPFNRRVASIRLSFGRTDTDLPAFRELMATKTLPHDWMYSAVEADSIEKKVSGALGILREVDRTLFDSIHHLIGAFFFARSLHLGGGSVSSLIG